MTTILQAIEPAWPVLAYSDDALIRIITKPGVKNRMQASAIQEIVKKYSRRARQLLRSKYPDYILDKIAQYALQRAMRHLKEVTYIYTHNNGLVRTSRGNYRTIDDMIRDKVPLYARIKAQEMGIDPDTLLTEDTPPEETEPDPWEEVTPKEKPVDYYERPPLKMPTPAELSKMPLKEMSHRHPTHVITELSKIMDTRMMDKGHFKEIILGGWGPEVVKWAVNTHARWETGRGLDDLLEWYRPAASHVRQYIVAAFFTIAKDKRYPGLATKAIDYLRRMMLKGDRRDSERAYAYLEEIGVDPFEGLKLDSLPHWFARIVEQLAREELARGTSKKDETRYQRPGFRPTTPTEEPINEPKPDPDPQTRKRMEKEVEEELGKTAEDPRGIIKEDRVTAILAVLFLSALLVVPLLKVVKVALPKLYKKILEFLKYLKKRFGWKPGKKDPRVENEAARFVANLPKEERNKLGRISERIWKRRK